MLLCKISKEEKNQGPFKFDLLPLGNKIKEMTFKTMK